MLTATLSVSRSGLKCADVVHTLKGLGVVCSVTPNTTVVRVGDNMRVESGCRVVIGQIATQQDVQHVWEELKRNHDLQCAHGRIHGDASGCVYDLFNGDTRCPG